MKYLTILLVLLTTIPCHAQLFTGCASNGSNTPGQQFSLSVTTGNFQLDQWIGREGDIIRAFFEVNASLFMYDDSGSPNARAFRQAETNLRPDGTVILGRAYVVQMYQFAGNMTVVPVTLAHEFGHIVDYKYRVNRFPGMKAELFADFMAGAYLFYRSYQTETDVIANLKWFMKIGDYAAINDPAHHGTPQQRLAAALAGYYWLKSNSYPGVNVINAIAGTKNYLNLN
ncbi:hypothetical protein [Pedobacter nutrimenti]|uniref:Metalloprotease n=1 Tax=Pedobacter nutrimenti TaxID=1241337 RepID=A0A318UD99_9SPHI|nr:hypothetical protein [Pedobacter nutrimenti]PYF74376.1 hypothetical protein B0O44_104547 [Pedobacter nutrimenti]